MKPIQTWPAPLRWTVGLAVWLVVYVPAAAIGATCEAVRDAWYGGRNSRWWDLISIGWYVIRTGNRK